MKAKDVKVGDIANEKYIVNFVKHYSNGSVMLVCGEDGKTYPEEEELDWIISADKMTLIDMEWMKEMGISMGNESDPKIRCNQLQKALLAAYRRGIFIGTALAKKEG